MKQDQIKAAIHRLLQVLDKHLNLQDNLYTQYLQYESDPLIEKNGIETDDQIKSIEIDDIKDEKQLNGHIKIEQSLDIDQSNESLDEDNSEVNGFEDPNEVVKIEADFGEEFGTEGTSI